MENHLFEPRAIVLKTSQKGLEWRLAAAAAKLRGAIFGSGERDLPDLEVVARLSPAASRAAGSPQPEIAGRVEADGRYLVEGLAPGRWFVVVTNPRRGSALLATVEIAEGQEEVEQDLDFGSWPAPGRRGSAAAATTSPAPTTS